MVYIHKGHNTVDCVAINNGVNNFYLADSGYGGYIQKEVFGSICSVCGRISRGKFYLAIT